ncbi:MAG: hypothetical protein IT431_17090 [Phycisphaerales bacterium]|nr:hypothetical protein [Phycisphaerales bacterium]
MTVTPFILATLALAATASRAQPDLLWDNGEWDGAKAISSERDTWVTESWVVDDFMVADGAVVRELEWLALWYPGFEPVATDVILLTADFEPVAELFDLGFASEFEGTAFGDIEVYRLTISGLSLHIESGRYYIGARFVGDGEGRGFAAGQYPISGESEAYFRSAHFGEPDWVPVSELGVSPLDTVFKVYGDIIPAPPTLALTALAPLAFRRRR